MIGEVFTPASGNYGRPGSCRVAVSRRADSNTNPLHWTCDAIPTRHTASISRTVEGRPTCRKIDAEHLGEGLIDLDEVRVTNDP